MTRRDGQLELVDVAGVDVARWNPRRRATRWGRPSPFPRPVANFGDLLGPLIVSGLVRQLGLLDAPVRRRLLAVGSVLHFARPGDVAWGTGLNAKAGEPADGVDVRAVRGPRSASLLPGSLAAGDPALLLGGLFPELVVPPERRSGITVVPNLNELRGLGSRRGVLNPRLPLRRVLRRIAGSELVVGSSLHGIVVAEALGVPARAVRSSAEPALKYEDHYLATGRDPDEVIAGSVAEAVELRGAPPPVWRPGPLLEAFPVDLWGGEADASARAAIEWRTREAAEGSRRDPRTGVTAG